jgi:hypothetical protein
METISFFGSIAKRSGRSNFLATACDGLSTQWKKDGAVLLSP